MTSRQSRPPKYDAKTLAVAIVDVSGLHRIQALHPNIADRDAAIKHYRRRLTKTNYLRLAVRCAPVMRLYSHLMAKEYLMK